MTDQDIDIIEKLCGIRLMQYQKEILKQYEPGTKLYVNMDRPRIQERIDYRVLATVVNTIIGRSDQHG